MARETLLGVITPPGWYDPTAAEFQSLCAVPVRTQQTLVSVPKLDYDDLNQIAAAAPEVECAAHLLGLTGPNAVAMTGTPFVWAGLSTEADVRNRLARVADAAGCPAVMAGTALMDALRALGVSQIAVATPYYTQRWRDHAALIFSACGFNVLAIRSADQLGLAPDISSIDDHQQSSGDAVLRECLRRLCNEAPSAEALVVVGSGARTLGMTPAMEVELGLPIVASDTAVYRALAKTLNIPLRRGRLGRMEQTLARI